MEKGTGEIFLVICCFGLLALSVFVSAKCLKLACAVVPHQKHALYVKLDKVGESVGFLWEARVEFVRIVSLVPSSSCEIIWMRPETVETCD